jgi:serine/threonine protein kinase
MDEHDALPAGTRFGELEILRVLGVGGFGIVYLAQDHALERQVALKEYMPSSLAGRGKGGYAVSIRSGAHSETYALGLRSFVNEARLLARFNHPSLVKVYRFWEENGTAYMVMPYLQGRTLREVRRSMNVPPSEVWIRSVIDPVMDALELLHSEDVYHRDIAPDNILLPPGEVPVLLDFGAARRAIGDRTQTFTAILKPSYAPIEQYAEAVALRQGPWTDLYALGAVVYYLLRGTPPPPATARAVQDDVPLLHAHENPAISEPFLGAIEWALAIRPADRPQNIAALREVLEGRATVPPRGRTGTTQPERTVKLPPREDTTNFAPTMPYEHEPAAALDLEATRPMTNPPPRVAPAVAAEEPTYPPVGQRTTVPPKVPVPAEPKPKAAPAPQVARDSTLDDTTVMPARRTVDKAPASRRGAWALAGVVGLVGAGALAAWMMTGRAPAGPVAGPAPAASAMAEPGALPDPAAALTHANAPAPAPTGNPVATAADAATTKTARPVGATPAVTAAEQTAAVKPGPSKDKPVRTADQPASVAHHDEAKPAERHAASAREEQPARAQQNNTEKQPTVVLMPPQGPATPREACGSRVFLALAVCMEEVCERPRFKNHPQCDKVRAIVERRKRNDGGD